jgi:lycopene cyclase domain-containing protein
MGQLTYLLLELVWAVPVIAGQWALGHRALRRHWRVLLIGVAVPTLYFSAADALAIRVGIWTLNPELTLGLRVGGLPLEEAVFFFVTNVMVVQGLILLEAAAPASSPPPGVTALEPPPPGQRPAPRD